jgi:hypothetical protein
MTQVGDDFPFLSLLNFFPCLFIRDLSLIFTWTIFSSWIARHRQQMRKDLYCAGLHADIQEKVVAKDFGDPLAQDPAL